jgi:F-box/leucine-rich repeat protein 10/11
MLKSTTFRRTAQDSKFTEMLKSKLVPLFPVKKTSAIEIRSLISNCGLEQPLLLDREESLKMGGLLPDPNMTLTDVANVIGPDTPIKIIEVESQGEITDRTLSEFADYLKNRTDSHKTLNMISLEVSATPLSTRVQAPQVVRDLDWIDFMWPLERRAR